jgi:lactoylglutathione lyase
LRYLHTMVRVSNLAAALDFYCDTLGLVEVFLAAAADAEAGDRDSSPLIELTYNWDPEAYDGGRNFGHLAFEVDDIHALCAHLMGKGVTINRPPRDGRMAFVRSPDGISIELLQRGSALAPAEPWASMPNTGVW